MRTRRLGNILFSVVWLMAAITLCSADVQVSTEWDETADFSGVRTYRWLPTPLYLGAASVEARDPRLDEKALDAPIRAAVDRALKRKRLKRAASTATPDLHVVYYAAFGVGMDSTVLGAHYGYVAGWGSPILGATPTKPPQLLDEGTLVVDILRRDRARAIWRGTATGAVQRARTDQERRRTIDAVVDQMFAYFPRAEP